MSIPAEISHLDTVLKKLKVKYISGQITLSENRDNATLTTVIVQNLSQDYFALKPDCSGFQIFTSGYGSKQCDYILLTEFEGNKVAVFVELKSSADEIDAVHQAPQINSDGKYEDYVTQLTGSNCLFDFLHSVLVNFCQCSALNTYKRYFVVLHNLEYSPISSPIPLTRPVSNTEPTTAYIRKTTNNEVLTIRQLIR